MIDLRRAAIASLALAIGGFVVGALVAAGFVTVYYLARSGLIILTSAHGQDIIFFNALICGGITGVSTPLLAWLGLRRVAIWRVVVLGATGATAGALVAATVGTSAHWWGLKSPIIGALAGSVVVGALLRLPVRSSNSPERE